MFLIEKEAKQPFDISQGPLIRFNLICLGDDDYIFQGVVHHIVFDGWSIGILRREFSELYWSFLNDQPSQLQDLPVQYVDFTTWQQQQMLSEEFKAQLNYWKKKLSGNFPRLELPMDKYSLSSATFKGERQSFLLSEINTSNQ